MDEHLITSLEAAAVFLAGRRRHRRMAELGMAFDIWRFPVLSIVPCGCKSIVIALLRYRRKIRRRGRFDICRVWMRTTG
jgi:hypothetical protein